MKSTLHNFYKPCLLLLALLSTGSLFAQTYNDGAMNIQMSVGYSFVQGVDMPNELNDYEFRWRWWGADNADLDGQGWIGGATIAANTGSVGWVNSQDINLLNHTYGTIGSTPQQVPQYVQLQGEGWEDDCFDCYRSTGTFTWACDQCSANINDHGCGCSQNILCGCSSEDNQCGPQTINSTINYRAVAPCLGLFSPPSVGNAWIGDFISSGCGNGNIAAEVLAVWTPPIPDPVVSTANVLCQPGLVTLQTGGAVFGGDYHWYNTAGNLLVGTGSQITPFVGVTTTFRVHTFNGSCESLSYRLYTVTVGQPNIVSVTKVDPACYGSTNGSITISATGGNGGLQYSINAGSTWQSSNVFSNLSAGFYNVWVKDASGCTAIYSGNSVVLNQPNPISIFVNKTDANCNGSSTGRIDIFAGGGSGNLFYSVNNGLSFQPSSIFANLAAGNYNIVVKDANNCTYPFAGNPVTISQPAAVSATATATDASCASTSNGTITVAATGGTAPYSYSLNNGPYFPNPTFTNVAAGNYTILAADVNGCTASTTATVGNTYTLVAAVQNQTDVSCHGGADGTVTATSTGGLGPFQFSIDLGTTWHADSLFTGLSGGTYTIIVKDFNGCTDNVTATVTERPVLTVTVAGTGQVNCFGDSTGSITLSTTGGDGNYTYVWSNGATTPNLSNAAAGTYQVVVTDGAACTASVNGTITQNNQLVLSVEHQVNVLCHGGNSGSLDITVNGGVPAYSYNWSNGSTSEDVYGINSSTYTLTVTDFAGCITSATYVVTEPGAQLGATTTATDVTCPGGNDGTVTASAFGGTPPYTYLWNNAQQGATISGLTAGTFVVTVKDSNYCETAKSVLLNQPQPFAIADSIVPAKCFNSSDGAVYILVSGGTAPYSYQWSNTTANQNLSPVAKGSYTLTVTDANACPYSQTFTVTAPDDIVSSIAGNDPACHAEETGFAVVSAGGGNPPYTYAWGTTPVQNGVMGVHLAGSVPYDVTITDVNGCTSVNTVTLNDPTPVTVSTVPDSVKCFNSNTGSVVIHATGGSGVYTYSLNNVYQQDSILTGLGAGEYTAIAQDSRGCFGATNFTISQPVAIVVNAGPDVVSLRSQPVTLSGSASSAHGIIGYIWSPATNLSCSNCAVTTANPDTTTTYYFTAIDGDSCSNIDSVTVIVKYAVQYYLPTAFTPNNDGLNDYFEVDILGASTIEVAIFNRWGQQVYFNKAQHNGLLNNGDAWDGKISGKPAPYDTYVYQLKAKFFDGSIEEKSGTITLVR